MPLLSFEGLEAVARAVAVQRGMDERNAVTPEEQRIVFPGWAWISANVIVESEYFTAMGWMSRPGSKRLLSRGICVSGTVCDHIDLTFDDLGEQSLKNMCVRFGRLQLGLAAEPRPCFWQQPPLLEAVGAEMTRLGMAVAALQAAAKGGASMGAGRGSSLTSADLPFSPAFAQRNQANMRPPNSCRQR